MTEKRFTIDVEETTQENALFENGKFVCFEDDTDEYLKKINEMSDENEQLKIRNKGKQAFMDKQDKIIRLLYNQCKDFKEILDDSNITYPIDERLNKFFEKGVKL